MDAVTVVMFISLTVATNSATALIAFRKGKGKGYILGANQIIREWKEHLNQTGGSR